MGPHGAAEPRARAVAAVVMEKEDQSCWRIGQQQLVLVVVCCVLCGCVLSCGSWYDIVGHLTHADTCPHSMQNLMLANVVQGWVSICMHNKLFTGNKNGIVQLGLAFVLKGKILHFCTLLCYFGSVSS